MKTVSERVEAFKVLEKKFPAPCKLDLGPSFEKDAIGSLIFSCLLWNAPAPQAIKAFAAIQSAVIDWNDFRQYLPEEMVELIGANYPLALERSRRIRAMLMDIFVRHYSLTLESLKGLSRKEVDIYFESLRGAPDFVRSRMLFLIGNWHVIPLDDRSHYLLVRENILDSGSTIQEGSNWITKQVSSSESKDFVLKMQSWLDRSRVNIDQIYHDARMAEALTHRRVPAPKETKVTKKTPKKKVVSKASKKKVVSKALKKKVASKASKKKVASKVSKKKVASKASKKKVASKVSKKKVASKVSKKKVVSKVTNKKAMAKVAKKASKKKIVAKKKTAVKVGKKVPKKKSTKSKKKGSRK